MTAITYTQRTEEDLSGLWRGELLQNEGGFADRFDLYFDIRHIGPSLQGKALVKLGELQAEMQLSGYRKPNGSWHVIETKIIRDNKNGLAVSWCMKQYELRVAYSRGELILTGPWWGNSAFGPCVPGSITLRRTKKVA